MKSQLFIVVLLALLAFTAGSVIAQELIIYPAKGQSQDQMEKDKFECYTWAKGQTGFDPPVLRRRPRKRKAWAAARSKVAWSVAPAVRLSAALPGAGKVPAKGWPSAVFPAAPSVVCAARGKTGRPNRSASSGNSSRPTSTCSSAMPTTAPRAPASRAGGIP